MKPGFSKTVAQSFRIAMLHRKTLGMSDWVDPQYYDFDQPGFTVIWTSYAKGRSALLKMPRAYRNYYTNSPDDFYPLLKFSGVSDIKYGYGMTELNSGFDMCSAGRYHVPPWIIPFILDPLTGDPKPREGVQEGRGAFFDLVPQSYWGGVISADHLEISWNPCTCGRTSPHIKDDIKRVTDAPEREHYIGPAPEAAVDAALAALNEGLE